jgi:hypothetical protein
LSGKENVVISEWIVAALHAPRKYRPLDSENRSPGTVDTAAGAEIRRNVLRRASLKSRKSHSAVRSSAVYDDSALVGVDETDIIGSGLIDIVVTGQTAKRPRCEVSLRLVGVS